MMRPRAGRAAVEPAAGTAGTPASSSGGARWTSSRPCPPGRARSGCEAQHSPEQPRAAKQLTARHAAATHLDGREAVAREVLGDEADGEAAPQAHRHAEEHVPAGRGQARRGRGEEGGVARPGPGAPPAAAADAPAGQRHREQQPGAPGRLGSSRGRSGSGSGGGGSSREQQQQASPPFGALTSSSPRGRAPRRRCR